MQLASPIFLILLIIVPALLFVSRKSRTPGLRFSDFTAGFATGIREMQHTPALKLLPLLKVMRFIGLLLLIITLARPQLSQSREHRFTEGIDILLVLDISESMRAEDFQGANRIQTAKTVINDFLAHRENDRIGLVVFAGESFTLCPLTPDYAVLTELLGDVAIGQLQDGTAIGDALATAVHRVRASTAETKIIILLTDGENNAGSINPTAAATLARSANIKVYTIGMGTEGGTRIPYPDTTFGKRYREVLTYLDEDTLKQIATATGGTYFRATDTQSLKQIYAEIDRFEKTEFQTITRVTHKELTAYFLVPAVILLCTEILLSHTVLRKIP